MSKEVDTGSGARAPHFSLVVGGPFYAVLSRLGLTGADRLPLPRAAVALALLAWLAPALLAVAQSVIDSSYSGWGFFTDPTVYTRYLVAVWVMIATERYADSRVTMLVNEFRDTRLVSKDGQPAFEAALGRADRRSSSWLAELFILFIAVAWSAFSIRYVIEMMGAGWEGVLFEGQTILSWAGEAERFWSNPLFLFLVLRWIWRFLVWNVLLLRISRLPLQLSPMHPDRSAGLGFLTTFPGIFSGLVFALSSVVASSMLKELNHVHHDANTIWLALGVWMAGVLIAFLGPLLVFMPRLLAIRDQAMLEYGRLANQWHRAFRREWLDAAKSGADLVGSSALTPMQGLHLGLQTIRELRVIPIFMPAVIQLVIAAGLPLMLVVLREVPLADIGKWILGKIL